MRMDVNGEKVCNLIFKTISKRQMKRCDSDTIYEIISAIRAPWFVPHFVRRSDINLDTLAEVVMNTDKRFPGYHEFIVSEVIREVKIILADLPRGDLSESKLTYLKKLGRFLGLVTLTQNRLVFDKDLDMKALTQDAILAGKDDILHVLRFMTQFLKGLNGSLIRPYNPYVIRLLRPLKCLYDQSSTDCSIKTEVRCINSLISFEIDTLCEAIGIKIGEILDIKAEASGITSMTTFKANVSGQSTEFSSDSEVDSLKEMPYIGYEVSVYFFKLIIFIYLHKMAGVLMVIISPLVDFRLHRGEGTSN
ncbi:unnamed protein product [Rodentolepis nana]|uniref:CNOT1_CAF1_bind domain-containing protein n=1 Tax=Rodentolepis nana TaxID=102285 RepID=A0A0R3TUA8_RODNA|nr:unnamed protein product [Rodentolepis nana]